jgi:hypothetical protein
MRAHQPLVEWRCALSLSSTMKRICGAVGRQLGLVMKPLGPLVLLISQGSDQPLSLFAPDLLTRDQGQAVALQQQADDEYDGAGFNQPSGGRPAVQQGYELILCRVPSCGTTYCGSEPGSLLIWPALDVPQSPPASHTKRPMPWATPW